MNPATTLHRLTLALCLTLSLALAGAAHAGRSCEEKPLQADTVVKAMTLAQKTYEALDASGAQVAFVARAGQDLSKYNLLYSHMALVWRDHPQGRWLVVHELNQCGTALSALFNEGLGNFFMDDMYRFQTLVVVPGPEVQANLARLLATNTPKRLHADQYNMLAYVFSTRYQNSNQWVLETYAAASAAPGTIETRAEAQNWLKQAHFNPITLQIPATTRLGARMFRANIAFDDHPFERRMAGQIDTTTVDSVVRFIKQNDPSTKEMVISSQ